MFLRNLRRMVQDTVSTLLPESPQSARDRPKKAQPETSRQNMVHTGENVDGMIDVDIQLDAEEQPLSGTEDLIQENTRLRAVLSQVRIVNDRLRESAQASGEERQALADRALLLEGGRKSLSDLHDQSRIANETLREKILEMQEQGKRSLARLQTFERKCRELEQRVRQGEETLLLSQNKHSETTRALEHHVRKQQETKALLDIRTAELREAQAALGAPSVHSHGDVQRMVEQLNAEVYQLSALIPDQIPFAEKQTSWCAGIHQIEHDDVCSIVGYGLSRALIRCSHENDPILVQVALQAYLVNRVNWVTTAWSLTANPSSYRFLGDLHTKIVEEEPQTVSSGWRLLTKRHMSRMDALRTEAPITDSLTDYLINGLTAILMLAGSPLTIENLRTRVRGDFEGKISGIATRAMKLRSVVGEEVTSAEFLPLCPTYNTGFEQEFMENADRPDHHSAQRQPVLCTVELGLCRFEKGVNEGAGGRIEHHVLTKAKVVLCTMVEEIVRNQEQSASRSRVQPQVDSASNATTQTENA